MPSSQAAVAYTQVGFSLNWELDVWGRLRRLNEAARAKYLASEDARRGIVNTLIADVTSSYLSLRELDAELEIARKTKDIAQDGLRLTTLRRDRGVVTGSTFISPYNSHLRRRRRLSALNGRLPMPKSKGRLRAQSR